MPFGAQLSDVEHYYFEYYLQVPLNLNIVQGGSGANGNMANLYMPWTGDILIEGWTSCVYEGGASILNIDCRAAGNIGPTSQWVGKRTESDGAGGWLAVPFFARWANLARGTYFQFGLQFNVGACNGQARAYSFAGSLKAQAT